MPRYCAVTRCKSSARMSERKFYRFPMINRKNPTILELTQCRQEAWLKALNRTDFPPTRYKHATICDRHFVSGRSANFTDVENVDWIPSLHLGYEPQGLAKGFDKIDSLDIPREDPLYLEFETFEIKTEPYEVNTDPNEVEEDPFEINERHQRDILQDVADGLDSDIIDSPKREQETPIHFVSLDTVGTQTDDAITHMSSDILAKYQAKIADLESMLSYVIQRSM